jgi:hypothetical protein
MSQPQLKLVTCIRCGHRWQVDLRALEKADSVLYRGERPLRIETFRLVCPKSNTVNMLEVTFEEK